jgi:biofilm PGA synthesis N-glycosyltransferase PgaC
MVGFFQLFGISFLFWIIVGCLRFIFETLRKLRDMPQSASRLNLIAASVAGVGLSSSLFFLVFFSFGFEESLLLEANTSALHISTFILWLACIGMGSYIAARIYAHEPYLLSFAVSMGTLAAVTTALLYSPSLSENLIPGDAGFAFGIFAATISIGFLGGHIARSMNALERERDAVRREASKHAQIEPKDVAILIAAHNEEVTIGTTVESVLAFADPANVYIASDGSSDKTVDVVRSLGAHADDIQPNRGKAGAIVYALEKNDILNRYKAVFLMDADLKVNKDFYTYALPQFNDPKVVAIIGHAVSLWPKHYLPYWHLFFTAYRIRLWRVLQFCMRYGQTWKYTNVSPIVPGGGSIYRSEALKKIDIVVPGLIIEDFNMTFDIHHKKLGLISFDPRAYVTNQEPWSLHDYVKQVYRWYLGYFQTMRHHGIWPSFFLFSTIFFTVELLFSSILFALMPFLILELLLGSKEILTLGVPFFGITVTLAGVVLTVLVLDYITTMIVAAIERKPMLLIYGPGFFFLRYVETWVFLYALVMGLFRKPSAEGKWKSPKRMAYSKS